MKYFYEKILSSSKTVGQQKTGMNKQLYSNKLSNMYMLYAIFKILSAEKYWKFKLIYSMQYTRFDKQNISRQPVDASTHTFYQLH